MARLDFGSHWLGWLVGLIGQDQLGWLIFSSQIGPIEPNLSSSRQIELILANNPPPEIHFARPGTPTHVHASKFGIYPQKWPHECGGVQKKANVDSDVSFFRQLGFQWGTFFEKVRTSRRAKIFIQHLNSPKLLGITIPPIVFLA